MLASSLWRLLIATTHLKNDVIMGLKLTTECRCKYCYHHDDSDDDDDADDDYIDDIMMLMLMNMMMIMMRVIRDKMVPIIMFIIPPAPELHSEPKTNIKGKM